MYSAQQSNLVSAYGDFISQWPWDHYGTFTFGRQLSQSRCLQHWDDFIDSLGRNTRGRVGWVRADEQRWSGYGSPEIPLHFHALLKYQNMPTPEAVAALGVQPICARRFRRLACCPSNRSGRDLTCTLRK